MRVTGFIKNKKLQSIITVTFIILFSISAAVTIFLINCSMKRQALAEADRKVRIISDISLSIHTYYSHKLKPVLFKDLEFKIKKNYFRAEWMSSTFAVREIHKYFKSFNDLDYYYKECAINARSPENEADNFEKKFIEGLNEKSGAEKLDLIRDYEGKPYFVSIKKGETMDKGCLRCHSDPSVAPAGLVEKYGDSRSFGRSESEVVSAISVRIPLAEAYGEANRFSFIFSLILLLILVLLLVILLWVNEKVIFSPLKMLRDKTEWIAQNHITSNEIIEEPFGRELRDLAMSFNRMSATINENFLNLEHKVEERTRQLREYSMTLAGEIDERKKTENELNRILEEKEILIKEVHHRVKNNFNVISSLITLKSADMAPEIKKVFTDIDNSLKSMSKIHELFYKSEKITNIDLGEYFNVLVNDLLYSSDLSGRKLAMVKELDNVSVNLNQAITCGLLVNEIITNSLKHAFPPAWDGNAEIYLSLKKVNDMIEIRAGDNGIGISDGADRNTSDSLGLKLIYMFPQQLGGSVSTERAGGTLYIVRYPLQE